MGKSRADVVLWYFMSASELYFIIPCSFLPCMCNSANDVVFQHYHGKTTVRATDLPLKTVNTGLQVPHSLQNRHSMVCYFIYTQWYLKHLEAVYNIPRDNIAIKIVQILSYILLLLERVVGTQPGFHLLLDSTNQYAECPPRSTFTLEWYKFCNGRTYTLRSLITLGVV